jgi:hypothetical protein
LLRAGMIVKKHREKKEGTTDKHRWTQIYYNNIINIFTPQHVTAKLPPAQRSNKHLTMKSQILKEA